jgi:hypothetical protein
MDPLQQQRVRSALLHYLPPSPPLSPSFPF